MLVHILMAMAVGNNEDATSLYKGNRHENSIQNARNH
jgi:hypothetical protein